MFNLRKNFDLRKIFAVPKDFLKSKIYCTKETEQEKEKEAQLILKNDTTTKVASDLDCMRFIKVNWFWFPDWSRARISKAKKVSLAVFRKKPSIASSFVDISFELGGEGYVFETAERTFPH